jgi:release factor glutamine methyltransferase
VTLADAVADAARTLAAAGISPNEARRDASVLARHHLQWDTARWLARRHEAPPPGFLPDLAATIARRARREPLALITGEREFYGRLFKVTSDVLIPRQETELVVDEALLRLPLDRFRLASATVIDAGTGSGCLAITLVHERPRLRVIAIDASEAAIDVARGNAQRLGVADRIDFRVASWPEGLTQDTPADLIVANPPYVPERGRAALASEVREFEPAAALFAGPDGLDAIRTLVPAAARALAPDGWLVMEIGDGQADDVAAIVAATPGLALDRIVPDLQSIPRVLIAHVPVLPAHRG